MIRNATILGAAVFTAVLAAPGARAGTPAAGVPQQIRSGFFADVNMGGTFTAGGSKVSNAQPYLQLGVGYDISRWVSLGASFGLGASAASCFGEVDPNKTPSCYGVDDQGRSIDLPDNFTITSIAAEVALRIPFGLEKRLTVQPKLHLGFSLLDPAPKAGVSKGGLTGFGLGVEYATHMDHFSIGADLWGNLLVGPNFTSFAFYPKVKYTF